MRNFLLMPLVLCFCSNTSVLSSQSLWERNIIDWFPNLQYNMCIEPCGHLGTIHNCSKSQRKMAMCVACDYHTFKWSSCFFTPLNSVTTEVFQTNSLDSNQIFCRKKAIDGSSHRQGSAVTVPVRHFAHMSLVTKSINLLTHLLFCPLATSPTRYRMASVTSVMMVQN